MIKSIKRNVSDSQVKLIVDDGEVFDAVLRRYTGDEAALDNILIDDELSKSINDIEIAQMISENPKNVSYIKSNAMKVVTKEALDILNSTEVTEDVVLDYSRGSFYAFFFLKTLYHKTKNDSFLNILRGTNFERSHIDRLIKSGKFFEVTRYLNDEQYLYNLYPTFRMLSESDEFGRRAEASEIIFDAEKMLSDAESKRSLVRFRRFFRNRSKFS